MKKINSSAGFFLLGLLMVLTSLLSYYLQPNENVLSSGGDYQVNNEIPAAFKDWSVDENVSPIKVDPQMQANIDKTYDQVLSRTYKNKRGDMVMLSIAYGKKQSKSLQVHKPETCYSAQGFFVKSLGNFDFDLQKHHLKARKLIATNGNRVEPIIYWIRVGDSLEYGGINQTIKRVKLGLSGKVADGLLFRVSTIDNNSAKAYDTELQFINDLIMSLNKESTEFLIGSS